MISSVAVESFSFTTGVMPQSSSACEGAAGVEVRRPVTHLGGRQQDLGAARAGAGQGAAPRRLQLPLADGGGGLQLGQPGGALAARQPAQAEGDGA